MIDEIKNYFYLTIGIIIAITILYPYGKALKLSREQKGSKPLPSHVQVASVIGIIIGAVLCSIVLKYSVSNWEDVFFPMYGALCFVGAGLGLIVALQAGYFHKEMRPKIFIFEKPEALALPVKASWALTGLALVFGIITGIVLSMVLIMVV